MVAMLEEVNKTMLLAVIGLELQHAHQIKVFWISGDWSPGNKCISYLHVDELRGY